MDPLLTQTFVHARCAGCSLARRAGEVMAGADGTVPTVLTGVHDVIVASTSPRKVLNWLRSGAGAPILAAIAGTMPLTHTALGITTTTATDWVTAAGGDWANYAADTARTRIAQPH